MTATKIIYDAWRRGGMPKYNTRDADGNDIVVECDFFDPLNHQHYNAAWIGECMVCGQHAGGGIPYNKMLSNTYTDWHIHKAQGSTHICKACAFCLLMNTSKNRMALKNYSFVAADKLYICNRAEMRDMLINPPEPPFVAVVAVSQKKHLATKAQVSYSKGRYVCMLEEQRIYVDLDLMRECMKLIEALRGIGMSKTDIGRRNIRYDLVKRWSTEKMVAAIKRLNEYEKSMILPLALHVAQKMDEEEAICCLGLTQKMKL